MHYIVGLGNPGKEYENTRHNVGFHMLQQFVEEAGLPSFHESSAQSGLLSEGVFQGQEISVLLPTTFMNASGSAVSKLVPASSSDRLTVIYDDVDIPVGEVKISFGRGDGGHNGIKSIIEKLGTKDFTRIRIGVSKRSLWTGKPVRPKGGSLSSYVLQKFSSKELVELKRVQETLKEMLAVLVTKGREAAMNQYN